MAKKIVRGITDVKTITNQDFDTNNVNDLLSDGQYNYIHRKKGKSEEYHNLTDNIKTISSDNTELLSVTNNNKTTNTATLHPKHDAQKEQVLESTDETIVISHGENGTEETTSVDVNFEKVQEKLTAGDGLAIESNEIKIKPKNVSTLPSKTGFYNGAFVEGEWDNPYSAISLNIDGSKYIQLAFRQSVNTADLIVAKYRFVVNNVPTNWKEMLLDSASITSLLSQKQNKLISDSEYITLDHQTDVNKTHIKTESLKQELQQLHETKQDVLVAGTGITIQGQTISATGSSTSTVQYFHSTYFRAYEHRVETSDGPLLTFSFECYNTAETVIEGTLKKDLEKFVRSGRTFSNGALTITYDGTTMKLINSAPSENVNQHATFTFYGETVTGGGGGSMS